MSYLKQILAVLIGLGLIVLVFVMVIKGFSSGSSNPASKVDLVSYANTQAVAQLTVDGPIVDQANHNSARISVSQTETQIEIMQGYDGKIVSSQTFPNTTASYAVFLQSLARLNFTKGTTTPYDERGYCATGERYIYQLEQGDKNILRYWSTSCGQGTFGGTRDAVRTLFEAQIPNDVLATVTANVSLN